MANFVHIYIFLEYPLYFIHLTNKGPVIDFNLFANTPVAATGFQTTAAYYTLRGDGLRGSQTYAAV